MNPSTREGKIEIADWVVETCLAFGTSVHTAFLVAGWFVQALDEERGVTGDPAPPASAPPP